MKRIICLLTATLLLCTGAAWAATIGTTNPALFTDHINWAQLGPEGTSYPSPQNWTSDNGGTGLVGKVDESPIYRINQGSWNGNFTAGEPLVYNNVAFGGTPSDMAVSSTTLLYGVGAYIQANIQAPFTATITLFDSSHNQIDAYTTNGVADANMGTALFIGMLDTNLEVAGAFFHVVDFYGNNDFALGTAGLSGGAAVPEPSTFILLGAGLGGMALLRRKARK